MGLKDKVALITGAAKRVGRVIALELARRGVHLVIHYNRSAEDAQRTAADARALGVHADSFSADLADPQAIEGLFTAVEANFGRLDVLINSASAFRRGAFLETTVEEWDHVMAVNLRAPFLTTQRAAHLMIARGGGGAIVNIGDMMGRAPDTNFPDHSVSKAGLLMLTQVSAKALGKHNIRVNAIVPGPVHKSEDISEERWQAIGAVLPLGRTGSALNVAQAAIALIENDYITGAILPVDGGDSLLSMEDISTGGA